MTGAMLPYLALLLGSPDGEALISWVDDKLSVAAAALAAGNNSAVHRPTAAETPASRLVVVWCDILKVPPYGYT